MKKLTTLFLLILVSQFSKAQSYTVYLNGNEWPGYAFSCYGAPYSGTISVNGSNSTFSYQWLNGDNSDTLSTSLNFTAPSGYYIFKIFINGVADNEFDFYIFEEDQLLSELTPSEHGSYNITSFGGNDGEISNTIQGGRTPYTYSWSNGKTTKDIDSLIAGTYSVTVTDNQGCQVTNSTTLIEPAGPLRVVSISSPTASSSIFNISEKGKTDGKINLVVAGGAGPYKYEWYPYGNPTNHPDTLAAREYTVVITDNNNATISQKITLREPDKLTLTLTKQDLSCHSCSNGNITATVTGGVSPYTYLWNSGQTTATISNLPATDYFVIVTDANGAKIKDGTYLKEPDRDDWSMTGNIGTNPVNNFIGTTDNKDLVFKTNNIERLSIKGNGLIDIKASLKISPPLTSNFNTVYVDNSGVLLLSQPPTNPCFYALPDIWYYNNCNSTPDVFLRSPFLRLGIGVIAPQERIHAVGFARFSDVSNYTTNYLNIGFDGNSKINSLGTDLLINFDSPKNVKVNTGSSQGSFLTGGNTYLATLNGRVGIGNSAPNDNVEIGNLFTLHSQSPNYWIGYNNIYTGSDNRIVPGFASRITFGDGGDIKLETAPNGSTTNPISSWSGIIIRNDGKVGIGISSGSNWDGTYKLYVKDGIRTEKIKVDVAQIAGWADHVFNSEYNKLSLSELENFININKHLPGIPSAADVVKNGIDLAEMDAKLLAKIEENALYIIEQKKEIDTLKEEINLFKKYFKKIKN